MTIFTAFDFNLEDFVAAQDSGLLTAFAASHNVTLLPNATFTRDARLRQVCVCGRVAVWPCGRVAVCVAGMHGDSRARDTRWFG